MMLKHPLGVIPVLGRIANRGPEEAPGDIDTVWQMVAFNNPANDYSMVGPSFRNIVDMADLDRTVSILCGGQSGHPLSQHYMDQVDMWRDGKVRPAPFSRAAIERHARQRQVLRAR